MGNSDLFCETIDPVVNATAGRMGHGEHDPLPGDSPRSLSFRLWYQTGYEFEQPLPADDI